MSTSSSGWKQVAEGAAGGLAGTVAIVSLLKASQRWAPQFFPPLREEPGEYMVETMERQLPASVRREIPTAVEAGAAQGLGMLYGIFFGALYSLLKRPKSNAVVDGTILGIGVWGAGYLGWLRVLGLMPPLRQQRSGEILAPLVEHVLYGISTVWVFHWLRSKW